MDDRERDQQPDGGRKNRIVAGIMIRGKGQPEASRVGLVWGALIAAAGVALLLDHLGFIVLGSLFRFWPMILVFFGVGHLFTPSTRAWGVILVSVGALLQLDKLGIIRFNFADMWPLAIIAVGVFLMWSTLQRPLPTSGTTDSTDMFNAVAIFSGCERRVKSQNFKGGRATSIFGGVELDLRDAKIEGDEATIEINCIFGGAEIRVPESWNVHSKSIPILGGFSDKTHISADADPAGGKRKTLIITGAIVFGGVEIDN
jgi:predicted membrane protein